MKMSLQRACVKKQLHCSMLSNVCQHHPEHVCFESVICLLEDRFPMTFSNGNNLHGLDIAMCFQSMP